MQRTVAGVGHRRITVGNVCDCQNNVPIARESAVDKIQDKTEHMFAITLNRSSETQNKSGRAAIGPAALIIYRQSGIQSYVRLGG